MTLDLAFVRQQFPAFSEPSLQGYAFMENAGGSYACSATTSRLTKYYRETKVQPKHPHKPAQLAWDAMQASRARWAQALNLEAEEVQFGPSTTANTYVLSHAFGQYLPKGSEIVVTNQDHEANSGAMRRMAERDGHRLIEWQVDQQTGQLDGADLDALISDKTALVCMPHCSNVVGQVNPVESWTKAVKAAPRSAHMADAPYVIVDGVSHAPHQIPDVTALGCDIYLFSLYKVYSVHQGLMAVRRATLDVLPNQAHYFNADMPTKRLTPAGPDHAQEASAQGILDYIEATDAHHGGGKGGLRASVNRVNALWHSHEQALQAPILAYLSGRNDVRLLGPSSAEGRHGTIGFSAHNHEAHALASALGKRGYGIGSGHFYAARLLNHTGVGADTGVTRLSLVHYNSPAEVQGLIAALDEAL